MDVSIRREETNLVQLKMLCEKVEQSDAFTDEEAKALRSIVQANDERIRNMKDKAYEFNTVWAEKMRLVSTHLAQRETILNSYASDDADVAVVYDIFRPEHERLTKYLDDVKTKLATDEAK